MAQSRKTGNSIVNDNRCITELLAAALSPDGTIEGLAEQLLGTIAVQQSEPTGEVEEFVIDVSELTGRQARRLLRAATRMFGDQIRSRNRHSS
jgi:hypothetical protein